MICEATPAPQPHLRTSHKTVKPRLKPGLWATKTTGSSLAAPASSPNDSSRRAAARRRRETEKSEKIEETFMSKRALVVAQVVEWQRCVLTTPSSIPLSAGLFFYFCHVLKQEVKCFHTKKQASFLNGISKK